MEIWGNRFLVVAVLTFVAALLLIEALYLLWAGWRGPRARRLRDRLQALAGHPQQVAPTLLKDSLAQHGNLLERFAQQLPGADALRLLLLQSGLGWTPGRLLALCTAAGALGAGATFALALPLPVAVPAMLAGAWLPVAWVGFRRNQRLRRIERQLPDALDLVGRGLRAGHAFGAALKMAGDELQDPIAAEFRAAHEEVNFGIALPQALANLAQRVPSMDVRYFVVSVLIHREAGGNLAEILASLARLVRERLKLLARVRVLSAEGRLSAWILVIMPFALAGVMLLLNPDFMRPLWTDPLGLAIVKVMLGLMAVGVVLLRRMVRIRV